MIGQRTIDGGLCLLHLCFFLAPGDLFVWKFYFWLYTCMV
uniref:Uncharacterized protein n=1 Tax=Rhizophora mucronata TaxID=61149 RepID=A0A2P2R3I5_RHIMU